MAKIEDRAYFPNLFDETDPEPTVYHIMRVNQKFNGGTVTLTPMLLCRAKFSTGHTRPLVPLWFARQAGVLCGRCGRILEND